MDRILVVVLFLLGVLSCKKETLKKVDVSEIGVSVQIDRFDKKFYTADSSSLIALKKEYPYLFPQQDHDSIWLQKIKDEKELFEASQKIFENFENEKIAIESLFKHVKYYHPTFKEPKIITLITNLDYENKVMYADSLLFVSLDMYLGKDHKVYQDFPKYLAQNFDKSQLLVDIAKTIGEHYFFTKKNRQFLSIMIDEGKKMYLIDKYLPKMTDADKMGYAIDKMDWVHANEAQIWKYFIENKLLYSTDTKLYQRFIEDAPFSKFYIDIEKESPGRVGVWMGWQIVRAYMNNNNVTLQQLLQTDAEEIFKRSKYKPRK